MVLNYTISYITKNGSVSIYQNKIINKNIDILYRKVYSELFEIIAIKEDCFNFKLIGTITHKYKVVANIKDSYSNREINTRTTKQVENLCFTLYTKEGRKKSFVRCNGNMYQIDYSVINRFDLYTIIGKHEFISYILNNYSPIIGFDFEEIFLGDYKNEDFDTYNF